MQVHVNTENLSASSSGNLVGAVWIAGEGFSFPSESWSDFVAPVLEQWATELRSISHRDGVARLRVFDGSDSMRIERAGELLLIRISHPSEVDREYRSSVQAITNLCETGRDCCDLLLAFGQDYSTEDRLRLESARGCFRPQGW